MTVTPPSVRIEPGLDTWSPDTAAHDLTGLVSRINDRAARLGTATLSQSPSPLIATGHQAQLWHPGILAKDIAMDLAAKRMDARTLHLVVDQDANEAWRLDTPHIKGDIATIRSLLLVDQPPGVPTGYQSPADPEVLLQRMTAIQSDRVECLRLVIQQLPACDSLAEQLAWVLSQLKQPYAGDIPIMLVSDLHGWPAFEATVTLMLHDAVTCTTAYNQAVAQVPAAGMAPMVVSRELIELPLWAARWDQPRRRVFVDLADSEPVFVFDDGEPIDRDQYALLPRALLLTAVMRSAVCNLFIHGTGGLVYDRITELWWQQWAGQPLAPIAGATADVFLNPDVPVAGPADLTRAVWRAHHLPHNLDRVLDLTGSAVDRKRDLLARMDDDRDTARRRDAFRELKQINQGLAELHAAELENAGRELRRTRAGVLNARIARRRDWCFALYPPESLHELRRLIEAGRPVPGEVQSTS